MGEAKSAGKCYKEIDKFTRYQLFGIGYIFDYIVMKSIKTIKPFVVFVVFYYLKNVIQITNETITFKKQTSIIFT